MSKGTTAGDGRMSVKLRVMAMPSLWGSLIKTKLIRVRARKRERGGSREEWQHSLGSPEF
jgi:hypothetical protein